MTPHLIITGYAAGLGEALKQQFESQGYHVSGIARTQGNYQADLTDPQQTQAAIVQAAQDHGAPQAVIHNVAELIRGPFLELDAQDFEQAWRSGVLSAINVSQSVLPMMQNQGSGTLILTGATASTRGSANFGPFSSAKFALRGLAQSLAREFQPKGIHVVHPILDGIIWSELSRTRFPSIKQENCLQPEDLAQVYWNLTQQPASTWTHEIDIRPQSESF